MKRDAIDFSAVPKHQQAMHLRLENWAKSLFGSTGCSVQPMFRLYRSDEHWIAPDPAIPVDQHDASKVGKGVAFLPRWHQQALNWYYVKGGNPTRACKTIGCTKASLQAYVIDGRQMLINRGV